MTRAARHSAAVPRGRKGARPADAGLAIRTHQLLPAYLAIERGAPLNPKRRSSANKEGRSAIRRKIVPSGAAPQGPPEPLRRPARRSAHHLPTTSTSSPSPPPSPASLPSADLPGCRRLRAVAGSRAYEGRKNTNGALQRSAGQQPGSAAPPHRRPRSAARTAPRIPRDRGPRRLLTRRGGAGPASPPPAPVYKGHPGPSLPPGEAGGILNPFLSCTSAGSILADVCGAGRFCGSPPPGPLGTQLRGRR